jgi:RND superfamily putative drug exporter
VTDVKILSTGLAAGIIIDATLIRGILAPALVALLGRFNWWLPVPMARLLHTAPLTPHPEIDRRCATSVSGPGASPADPPNAAADCRARRFS